MTPESISEWLQQYKLSAGIASMLGHLGAGISLFILVLLANFLSKRLITYVIYPLIEKTF